MRKKTMNPARALSYFLAFLLILPAQPAESAFTPPQAAPALQEVQAEINPAEPSRAGTDEPAESAKLADPTAEFLDDTLTLFSHAGEEHPLFLGVEEGETVSGVVEIRPNPDELPGIRKVAYYLNGTQSGKVYQSPFIWGGPSGDGTTGFDTTTIADGDYTLRMVYTDTTGDHTLLINFSVDHSTPEEDGFVVEGGTVEENGNEVRITGENVILRVNDSDALAGRDVLMEAETIQILSGNPSAEFRFGSLRVNASGELAVDVDLLAAENYPGAAQGIEISSPLTQLGASINKDRIGQGGLERIVIVGDILLTETSDPAPIEIHGGGLLIDGKMDGNQALELTTTTGVGVVTGDVGSQMPLASFSFSSFDDPPIEFQIEVQSVQTNGSITLAPATAAASVNGNLISLISGSINAHGIIVPRRDISIQLSGEDRSGDQIFFGDSGGETSGIRSDFDVVLDASNGKIVLASPFEAFEPGFFVENGDIVLTAEEVSLAASLGTVPGPETARGIIEALNGQIITDAMFTFDSSLGIYPEAEWILRDSTGETVIRRDEVPQGDPRVLGVTEGETVSGVVEIRPNPAELPGVRKVAYYLNGTKSGKVYQSPFICGGPAGDGTGGFDTTQIADGDYTLAMTYTDGTGDHQIRVSFTIDNTTGGPDPDPDPDPEMRDAVAVSHEQGAIFTNVHAAGTLSVSDIFSALQNRYGVTNISLAELESLQDEFSPPVYEGGEPGDIQEQYLFDVYEFVEQGDQILILFTAFIKRARVTSDCNPSGSTNCTRETLAPRYYSKGLLKSSLHPGGVAVFPAQLEDANAFAAGFTSAGELALVIEDDIFDTEDVARVDVYDRNGQVIATGSTADLDRSLAPPVPAASTVPEQAEVRYTLAYGDSDLQHEALATRMNANGAGLIFMDGWALNFHGPLAAEAATEDPVFSSAHSEGYTAMAKSGRHPTSGVYYAGIHFLSTAHPAGVEIELKNRDMRITGFTAEGYLVAQDQIEGRWYVFDQDGQLTATTLNAVEGGADPEPDPDPDSEVLGVTEGEVLSGTVEIRPNPEQLPGVRKVAYYLNGSKSGKVYQSPFIWGGPAGDGTGGFDTTQIPDGDYTLAMVYTDAGGDHTIQIHFSVNNTNPPETAGGNVTGISEGETVDGAIFVAPDSSLEVTREEYFVDGVRIYRNFTLPFIWGGPDGFDTTELADGSHTLRGVFLTPSGEVSFGPLGFTVANGPPPANQAQAAMLGDSLIERGNWGLRTGRGANMHNEGVGGEKTWQMRARVAALTARNPAAVLVMGGINDLLDGDPVETVFENLKAIIGELQAAGITPVLHATLYINHPNFNGVNPKVTQLNALLETYASENSIEYVDLNPALSENGTLKAEYTYDGVHLSDGAYQIWIQAILPVLERFDP